jgi:hypothetical protein
MGITLFIKGDLVSLCEPLSLFHHINFTIHQDKRNHLTKSHLLNLDLHSSFILCNPFT